MDVGAWLRGLGLGQYEAVFRDSEIDADVLPELTDQHLKGLGVLLGHRLKLLRAIREIGIDEPLSDRSPALREPRTQDTAERRQLTVMFCDLVGSTALSARLDPEDMREVIRAYQNVCSGAVARYDGFVAKFMGDGVLAYFGFPRAHEEDAERAVRAGLDIAQSVAKLQVGAAETLQARIGIATGIVVVGDLIGQGSAQEQVVVGETPNLAARLQGLAEPGSVVVAEATRRLLRGAFELKALGLQELKGLGAPVLAWAVVREVENLSRFEASRSDTMTPFVGREREVVLLVDRWRHATDGKGKVVLLSGEAGIGKSRILAALRERVVEERPAVLRYQCSPHHVNEAFHPIIGQIRRAAGLAIDEPTVERLDKLEAMIARSGMDTNLAAPLLAALLSIPTEGRYAAPEMAPAEAKERTIATLIDLFVGLTNDGPVLALLEDAHWIDPTSLDVFGRLIERLQGLPALLVVTHRPEFAAPWVGRAHVSALALNRFDRRHSLAMIDSVTSGKALPPEVLEQIVSKTDGVPLFVEELTKTVLESGLLREEGDAFVLATNLTPLAIPSTLQDSLMARLDRLASVKEIAQIGAAIGREFSYRLLEAVSPLAGPALQQALGQLTTAELIHARGAPPEATYVFKHALVQDTAYASLLRGRRQRIHADIAAALSGRFADATESAPAVIAHHYGEAGLVDPAVRSWLAAAEMALSRSAPLEADRYVEAGLALIPRLDGPDRRSLELALQLARANALRPVKGFNTPETVAALTAAQGLLDSGVGTDSQRFSALHGLCVANHVGARIEPALALARQIVAVADRMDEGIYRLVAYRLLGMVLICAGKNREALEALQQAELSRGAARIKSGGYWFGTDPALNVLCWKTMALVLLGFEEQAAAVRDQLAAEFQQHVHAPTVAACACFGKVWPEFLQDDLAAYERDALELVAYCTDKNVRQYGLFAGIYLACARMMREPTEERIAAARSAINFYHRSGAYVYDSVHISRLVEALLIANDVDGAENALKEAFAFVERSGERFWLSDLHRLEGRIAWRRSEPDCARAEACFLQAIEIAHSQEARLLELRAATDLARLWRDSGSRRDPHALLEPILVAIEGGEALRDVRNARALLAETV